LCLDFYGAVDGLNLYVYVGNNPLKYIDPTGHVRVYPIDRKVHSNRHLPYNEIDILSPMGLSILPTKELGI
jgi:hypothetical protein